MPKGVLLDTSFFLRFLNETDPLFANADSYFKYFIEHDIPMMMSTISIGEYCVKGETHELPLKNLQILRLTSTMPNERANLRESCLITKAL